MKWWFRDNWPEYLYEHGRSLWIMLWKHIYALHVCNRLAFDDHSIEKKWSCFKSNCEIELRTMDNRQTWNTCLFVIRKSIFVFFKFWLVFSSSVWLFVVFFSVSCCRQQCRIGYSYWTMLIHLFRLMPFIQMLSEKKEDHFGGLRPCLCDQTINLWSDNWRVFRKKSIFHWNFCSFRSDQLASPCVILLIWIRSLLWS